MRPVPAVQYVGCAERSIIEREIPPVESVCRICLTKSSTQKKDCPMMGQILCFWLQSMDDHCICWWYCMQAV